MHAVPDSADPRESAGRPSVVASRYPWTRPVRMVPYGLTHAVFGCRVCMRDIRSREIESWPTPEEVAAHLADVHGLVGDDT